MKALAKFLTVLLGFALALTATISVLNATIWSSDYMKTKLASQQVADNLAAVIPELAAKLAGSPEETKAAVQAAVTPQYIHDQLVTLVPQLVAYYKSGGQAPLIDLRDLEQRVAAEGLTLPANVQSYIETPQPASAGPLDGSLLATARWEALLTWAAPLSVLVLAVLIFLTAGRERWLNLAVGTVSGSAITLLAALVSYAPSPLVSSALNTSNLKLLSSVAHTITDAIAHDQVAMFLGWAKWYAIAAAVLFVIHLLARFLRPRHKPKKGSGNPTGYNGMPEFN